MSYDIVNELFKENSLVKHQIDSYNQFVRFEIQKIIDDVGSIEISKGTTKHTINFQNISMSKPIHVELNGQKNVIMPSEAKLRNVTYCSMLHVNINHMINDEIVSQEICELGNLPIMVKSDYCNLNGQDLKNECKYDLGGYFIVSGNEKVIISQEKMNNNQVYVFEKHVGKVEYEAEMRSIEENDTKSTSSFKIMLIRVSNGEYKLMAQLPFLRCDIPAFAMFAMLGLNYKGFIQLHKNDAIEDVLFYSAQDYEDECLNKEDDVLKYIEKRLSSREKSLEIVLQKYMLPHMKTNRKKGFMLGYMINKLIEVFAGKRLQDDRDHFKNKRIDLPGDLLAGLFRQLYKKVHKDMSGSLQKSVDNNGSVIINNMLKNKIITNGLKYALATGNWGIGPSSGVRSGVSQVLSRHSYLSTLSHLRRINSPIGKEGKLTAPRQLHGSHAYRICPCETPEGGTCGLVKNIALTCSISSKISSYYIRDIITELGINDLEDCQTINDKRCKVFVNGFWMGFHDNHSLLLDELKSLKRTCDISPDTGIAYDEEYNEIRVYTDSGRCCRPLFVVKDNKLLEYDSNMSFSALLSNGVVEFLDSDEEESALIAFSVADMDKRSDTPFTHCELHPSMMLGICAAMIPYSNHNQAPRNVYQSAMCKQAMGQYATNHQSRLDSYSHVLWYPQKPLVKTKTHDTFNFDEMPSGINAIVAIACYGGYNQEDSLIMNQSSIDKGMFRSYFYRTYKDETKQHGSSCKDIIEKPDSNETVGIRHANYDKLDDDGIAKPGEFLDSEDIIIGKTSTIAHSTDTGRNKKDYSTIIRHNEGGYVDQVMVTTNEQGQFMTKAKVRSMRVPEIGDKFCLTGDHEVLTDSGWKFIPEVKQNDIVATLNPDTFQLEYQAVSETYKFDARGDILYGVKNSNIDILATAEHKMFIRHLHGSPELKEIKNITNDIVYYYNQVLGQEKEKVQYDTAGGGLNQILVQPLDNYTIKSFSNVYCISVPNHIFYVRRNGKPVWTGNSSRHGQKGTVGITLTNEDMPFTADGIVPDIIVNPHAIPSRMTVAQLIECISGKVCAIDGERKDATTFDHDSADEIAKQLESVGYEKYGSEQLFCGYTGEKMEARIFIGPTYYQRLKHMVNDKVHGRGRGPIQILTRQPVEGRSRAGGLRFGEMERDCLISHGGSAFLKERLMDQSDAYTTCVCKKCGFIAVNDKQRGIKICKGCKTSEHCADVTIPYACKLLFQELMSMNIAPRMILE